jgi:hypothetical protein
VSSSGYQRAIGLESKNNRQPAVVDRIWTEGCGSYGVTGKWD